jgi:hypothetical protein
MKKKHLSWLLLGTLFWGSLLGLFHGLLFPDSNLMWSVLEFIILTFFTTLIVQYYGGGFTVISPKACFFIPLVCMIVAIVWGSIEMQFTGEWNF